jgi:hypothetical protein
MSFLAKKLQRKNRMFYYHYAAASVALICLIGSLFFIYNQTMINQDELLVATTLKLTVPLQTSS